MRERKNSAQTCYGLWTTIRYPKVLTTLSEQVGEWDDWRRRKDRTGGRVGQTKHPLEVFEWFHKHLKQEHSLETRRKNKIRAWNIPGEPSGSVKMNSECSLLCSRAQHLVAATFGQWPNWQQNLSTDVCLWSIEHHSGRSYIAIVLVQESSSSRNVLGCSVSKLTSNEFNLI